MSHTPGPWRAVYDRHTNDSNLFEIAEVSHFRIILESGGWPTQQGTPEDDARLIAAAPDLLVALRDCEITVNTLDRCYTHNAKNFAAALMDVREAAANARIAIAKATGEKA